MSHKITSKLPSASVASGKILAVPPQRGACVPVIDAYCTALPQAAPVLTDWGKGRQRRTGGMVSGFAPGGSLGTHIWMEEVTLTLTLTLTGAPTYHFKG